jgi:excisionase family DNA binding protein
MSLASPTTMSPEEIEIAKRSHRQIAEFARSGRPMSVHLGDSATAPLELPPTAVKLLAQILADLAVGRQLAVIAHDAELSTQEAADILKVSRPYLVRLLEEKKLPSRKVGTHRRIRLDDCLRYKESIDAERRRVLDALTAEAEELNLGY